MSSAVELVLVAQVRIGAGRLLEREIGVDVSVCMLRSGDLLDQGIEALVQLGAFTSLGHQRENVRSAFEHLVHIGVIEDVPLVGASRTAPQFRRGIGEVRDAACLLALGPVGIQRRASVHCLPSCQKPAFEADLREWDWFHPLSMGG